MSAPEIGRGTASAPAEPVPAPDPAAPAPDPDAVEPSTGPRHRRSWWRRGDRRPSGPPLHLGPALLAVLGTWIGSRLAVLVASLLGARAVENPQASRVPSLIDVWNHWDVGLFVKVAHFGYLSPAYADRTEVDFPGMPIAMRLVHPFVGNYDGDWLVAGLVVSFVAGLVASAALWRLAVDEEMGAAGVPGGRAPTAEAADRGRRAVLLLVCFPYAVFLFAGYSEALFLAFAATAWVCVRRERWALAALCTAGATGTRVLGLALVAALWVEYLHSVISEHGRTGSWQWRRRPQQVAWMLVPLGPILAFLAYFQVRTGHWDAYTRAMREHWGRTLAAPWDGFVTTWRQAMSTGQASAFRVFWWAELAAVLVGVVLVVVLLRSRRWGEATFVGVSTLIMSCSSYWASGVRAVLVWFPLYLVLARRPKLLAPVLWIAAPLAVVFVVAFSSGVWVD